MRKKLGIQDKLISARMGARITQAEMAKVIGKDVRTYVNKEQGITQFKANEMFAIARHLNSDIGTIFVPTNFIKHEVCV